jgi:RNAse (barnase) inhibitor barstar
MTAEQHVDIELLARARPPWLLWLAVSGDDPWRLAPGSAIQVDVDGRRMRTFDDLLEELDTAFTLPDYFGRNWDALDECLADLSWLRGDAYVVVVRHGDEVLEDEQADQLATFVRLLDRVAGEWAEPTDLDQPWGHEAVPFHVVFRVTPDRFAPTERRFASAAPGVGFGVLRL